MSTETMIFIGVAIYMVMMINIGLYASKRSRSVTDFMVAGRGLPTSLDLPDRLDTLPLFKKS